MSHQHQTSGPGGQNAGRKLHKDWRVWVGVILMLGCMIIYLLTMDESVVPVVSTTTNAPVQP